MNVGMHSFKHENQYITHIYTYIHILVNFGFILYGVLHCIHLFCCQLKSAHKYCRQKSLGQQYLGRQTASLMKHQIIRKAYIFLVKLVFTYAASAVSIVSISKKILAE